MANFESLTIFYPMWNEEETIGRAVAAAFDAGDALIRADLAAHIGQTFLPGIGVGGAFGLYVFDSGFDASDLHCGFDQLEDGGRWSLPASVNG